MIGGFDMKKVCKNMFKVCAFLLLAAGAAQPVLAQDKAVKRPKHHYYNTIIAIKPGDSIYVHPDSLYYLTGERISKWVYDVPHQVQQVGGRRYPQGVLIKGIYSWVYPYTINPLRIEDPCMALPEGLVRTVVYDTVCGQYLWEANNQIYTMSGEYTYKDTTVNGCDSVVTLHLVVNQPSHVDSLVTICQDELPYKWYDIEMTAAGDASYVVGTNAAGCDSIVNLHLVVNQLHKKDTTVYIKKHKLPYTWNGIVMTEAGDTSVVLGTNAAGCDSIATLHLNVYTGRNPLTATPPVLTKIYFNPFDEDEKLGWVPDIPYETERFAIGLRGGYASNLAGLKKVPFGVDALLDLHYAHYWVKSEGKPAWGITTGLNIGYLQTHQTTSINDEYTAVTDDGNVDYKITADKVVETDHNLQLEVPVMFSMITTKGLFLNAGPKLILPVYSKYHQTLTNPNISAYLPELDNNPIVNEVVMGKVMAQQCDITGKVVNNPCQLLSLALGAELGYEFKLKNGHSIDLGIYADYSVYNMYKNDNRNEKIIEVVPPTYNSAAIVNVQPITNAFANKFGLLDVGFKITYNLDKHYYWGYK